MVLYIKYMVSLRCMMIVKAELKKLKIRVLSAEFGVVEILEDLTEDQHKTLKVKLKTDGMNLLDKKNCEILEKLSDTVIKMIHNSDEVNKNDYLNYLKEKIDFDYTKLTNLYSEVRGITVEQFITINIIEKAKGLLLYEKATVKEISKLLNYKNEAQLVREFKKVTGLTPSFFKKIKRKRSSGLAIGGAKV